MEREEARVERSGGAAWPKRRAQEGAERPGDDDTGREKADPVDGRQGALGSVYILETDDKTLIKVGFTTRLTMRLEQHRAFARRELKCGVRLIGFFPATIRVESAIHRAFAHCRVSSEWYDRAAVLEHIAHFGLPESPSHEVEDSSPAAVALGRKRAALMTEEERRKAGQARMKQMTKAERKALAETAANARWGKKAAKKAAKKRRMS
jgi:hypothetical protein